MSDNGASKPGPTPGDRTVIGITFGNSNSSIAYTVDDKAEVIANEDGGENECGPLACCTFC
jgi:molecular chaperone DnaK (HSP70)